jgi:tRNA pseudouridine55 synthase
VSVAAGRQARARWRRVDGVLLLDKPSGLTSNAALQASRRLYQAEKAGHTGTLDPLASGLLPICFGEATKFAGELLGADKSYCATVQLGIVTDTGDAEGHVLATHPVDVEPEALASCLAGFLGESQQIPPMHSALKRDGRPLYEYARAGIELAREPRRVVIHEIALVDDETDLARRRFAFTVRCSKGTYVRTLATDLGERLGCGAHLAALRRTAIGGLDLAYAHTLAQLDQTDAVGREALLLPMDSLLSELPEVRLPAESAIRLCHGQAVPVAAAAATRVRVYGSQAEFLGVCAITPYGLLRPVRLLSPGSGA